MRWFLRYLLGINIITFFIWGYDKWMARINGFRLEKAKETRESQEGKTRAERVPTRTRISEKQLLCLIVLGGGGGALFGMSVFRHKTRKGSFLWKALGIMFVQLCVFFIMVSSD